MKSYKKILFLFLILIFASVRAEKQNNDPISINQRTPEQEASKQTEKLQTELNLTREQVKALYQINLRYAQARQNVTNRSEVMQIIKKKDEDIRRVLTNEQNDQLESKRLTRQQVEVGDNIEYTRTNPQMRSSFRSNENEGRNVRGSRTSDENSSVRSSRGEQNRPVRQQPVRNNDGGRSSSSYRSNDNNSSARGSSSYSSPTRSSSSSTPTRSSNESSTQRSGGRR